MKKLIITGAILLALIVSCFTVPIDYNKKPDVCFLWGDGSRFLFCVDGRKFGIMLTPSGVLFGGMEGKCECISENEGRTL